MTEHQQIYQKQAPDNAPVDPVTVPSGNDRGHVEHVVDDVEGLRYLANQAVVELHRWLCRPDDLDHPDLMIIDRRALGTRRVRTPSCAGDETGLSLRSAERAP